MSIGHQLSSRFREVLLDGKWVANTNFKKALTDVSWEQANKKIDSLNTIGALTFHVNYYIAGILNVFKGGSLDIRDKYSYDAPPIKSQEDWDQLLAEVWSNAEQFADHLETMSDEVLKGPFVVEKYGEYRRNIEGVIEHCYYHLGQVILLKKMLGDV